MATNVFTVQHVHQIAKLANLSIDSSDVDNMTQAFINTLSVVDELQKLDVTGVEPTSQVTGLENIYREDVVGESFSQKDALSNAKHTTNGYFVVDAILE